MKWWAMERGREGERERGGSAALVVMIWLSLSGVVEAQTELRWKLKAGESLGVVIGQKTESLVAYGAKSATTNIDVKVSLGWEVTAADENGFSIKQTIERIKMDLAMPQGPAIGYDSESKSRPAGQARDLTTTLQPLVGAEFAIKLSPRGEVLKAEPVNEAAKALFAANEKGGEAGDAPRATVEKLLRQSLVVLPEKAVKAGESWTTSSELATAAGPKTQETTYTLEKMGQADGNSEAEISMVSTLSPRERDSLGKKENTRLKIMTHEQQGTILFAAQAGRVTSAEQTQKLVTEREYQGTKIVVTLNSTQKTTVEAR
jgi:hypothetical protein